MTLKKDLEELEGSVFLKQCDICVFQGMGIEGEYCYMCDSPPETKCNVRVVKRSVLEANAIQGLYKKFPNLTEGD